MPIDRKRYPDNWDEIADQVKQESRWLCERCSLNCDPVLHAKLDRSERVRRTLTVHHQDYNPANNDRSNLIALCSVCHLLKHQGRRGNITEGQLSLWPTN